MDLKSLLLPEKQAEFDYPGCDGFKVTLAFISKEEMGKITKKCNNKVLDKKTRKMVDEFDAELFSKLYTKRVLKGWKGLKYKYLCKFLLADINDLNPEDELEFSEENALTLMLNSNDFDNWVFEMMSDLELFTNPD